MYDELCAKITEKTGRTAEPVTVLKGGIQKTGIRIDNGAVCPTLYPDNFPGDIDEQAEAICAALDRLPELKIDLDIINDWKAARDHIQLCLRPITDCTTQPTKRYLDLEVYGRLWFDENKSCMITNDILKKWDITPDEFFTAIPTPQAVPFSFMLTMTGADTAELASETIDLESAGMVVLSTPNKIHGASAILDTATLDKIAANNGGSFYVIPSSIHECMLLADIAPLDELREMVKAVNDTTVAPEERLSYSVYIYKDGALQIAA